MAASACGIEVTESRLSEVCHTTIWGTEPEDLLYGAKALGLRAFIADEDDNALDLDHLDCEKQLIIPYLYYQLIDPTFETHAVLLRQFGDKVVFLDPAPGNDMAPGERIVSNELFRRAWEVHRYVAIVITGKREP